MTYNVEKCRWCGAHDPRLWEVHKKSFRHRAWVAVTALFWMA
ncbi:hypothetical protein [Mycolicibacterium houstonense]|nr:hypothetical protein [Mycolicibacterium houstonense]